MSENRHISEYRSLHLRVILYSHHADGGLDRILEKLDYLDCELTLCRRFDHFRHELESSVQNRAFYDFCILDADGPPALMSRIYHWLMRRHGELYLVAYSRAFDYDSLEHHYYGSHDNKYHLECLLDRLPGQQELLFEYYAIPYPNAIQWQRAETMTQNRLKYYSGNRGYSIPSGKADPFKQHTGFITSPGLVTAWEKRDGKKVFLSNLPDGSVLTIEAEQYVNEASYFENIYFQEGILFSEAYLISARIDEVNLTLYEECSVSLVLNPEQITFQSGQRQVSGAACGPLIKRLKGNSPKWKKQKDFDSRYAVSISSHNKRIPYSMITDQEGLELVIDLDSKELWISNQYRFDNSS